jgi:putative Mn2+ efflux pump MntP
MWQIFLGSLLLSLIHALIPHHWIPIIAISKTEKWTNREAIYATLVTGLSHMISTIVIGIVVGFVGIKLFEKYSSITSVVAPTILLVIGVVYLILDFRSGHHHHHFDLDDEKLKNRKSMFLTPCVEIEAYYFQAANFGWAGIFIVSGVYLIMTLLFMSALVYFGLNGVNKLNLSFLEHHAKRITGVVLIALGIVAYFVEF